MCENTIELKNIYSMSGMKFFIPIISVDIDGLLPKQSKC